MWRFCKMRAIFLWSANVLTHMLPLCALQEALAVKQNNIAAITMNMEQVWRRIVPSTMQLISFPALFFDCLVCSCAPSVTCRK
eukprot:SAG22_NODE_1291_length_4852_cov_3.176310_5_plen_83_part_00